MITLAGRLVSAGFYIRKPVEASYIGEENRLSKLQVWWAAKFPDSLGGAECAGDLAMAFLPSQLHRCDALIIFHGGIGAVLEQ